MSDTNLVPATLTIIPQLPIKGIYYIGQYGTSGYASAARGYLYHYFSNGLSVTWEPLRFDNSRLDDNDIYDVVIKSLIKKEIDNYEMVIMHSTPDLWPGFWKDKMDILRGKIVNGYCTWETNRLPSEWVKCINGYVNEVWCPSHYNETCFIESGVEKPIRVVPHIFLPYNLPSPSSVKIIDQNGNIIKKNGRFTFYTIGEMHTRKGIEDTIKVFCNAFKESDPVQLILKVHYRGYMEDNKKTCERLIKDTLKDIPSHPPIICLFNSMSNKEMLGLHALGDCYVGLVKSEGFGLPIFDAFNYKKKIITTGYGGQIEFLGKDYPGLVGYKLGPVVGMTSFSKNYTEDQLWAYPDLVHAQELMRKMI